MLLPLATFCLVTSITPGPNNMMLLSSGATFGLRRTVPHMLGISGGCALMVLIVGSALSGVTRLLPQIYTPLQCAAAAYMAYLAWRIATSSGLDRSGTDSRPLGFVGAAAFQWVNPKAWAMVLGAVVNFARPERMAWDVPLIALVLVVVGFPCISLWAACGAGMRSWLQRPGTLRLFNWTMALLLVASTLPGLWQALSPAVSA